MKNKNTNYDVLIIGAGLTGLTLAYLLRESGLSIKIIEARNRIGGRIFTKGYDSKQPLEMGATWLGSQHRKLIQLLDELKIGVFDQTIGNKAIYEAISTSPHYLANLPPNPDPSKRIQGGTERLIHRLSESMNKENVILNQSVTSIEELETSLKVNTEDQTFYASKVISTLPPNLLVSTIDFNPKLPKEITQVAQDTHTWMGESIKVTFTYAEPFWRDTKFSGTIMSNVGPIGEMYDHSNFEDSFYALKGFFSGNYFSISRDERLTMCLQQLRKYYGSQVDDFLTYEEAVWRNEKFTFANYNNHVLPHQNNGHPDFQKLFLNGRFIIGGTETAKSYPGYMEGAVISAINIAKKLL